MSFTSHPQGGPHLCSTDAELFQDIFYCFLKWPYKPCFQVCFSPTPSQEQVGQIINSKTKKADSFFKTIRNSCGQLLCLQCFQAPDCAIRLTQHSAIRNKTGAQALKKENGSKHKKLFSTFNS